MSPKNTVWIFSSKILCHGLFLTLSLGGGRVGNKKAVRVLWDSHNGERQAGTKADGDRDVPRHRLP